MSKSLKDRKTPRYVATSGVKVQRYFPGKAPEGHVDDISASESGEEADELRPATHASEIISIAITDLKANTNVSSTLKNDDYLGSSDGSSSESESDAETKRLLQVRLRARQLAKDDDSSDSEDGSDQHSASAKVRSESQARKHDTVQIPIQDIQEALTNRALHPHKELSQTSEVSLESESESTDTDSSESTEGYAPQVLLKPMFVPKSQRLSKSQGNDIVPGNANNTEGIGDDEIDRKRQERRDESIRMAAEEAARSRQQPDIDDADELNVDDTDDMDVEAEFGAWRLREISRIERDKTEKEEADAEEEEREQAQNMTEEEKNRVGLERARKQRKDKAQERAEKAVSFTKKEQTDSNVSMNDRMTQDMLEYALNTNNGRKGNSKWRGYGKEDTSSDQSLWNKGVRQSRKR